MRCSAPSIHCLEMTDETKGALKLFVIPLTKIRYYIHCLTNGFEDDGTSKRCSVFSLHVPNFLIYFLAIYIVVSLNQKLKDTFGNDLEQYNIYLEELLII